MLKKAFHTIFASYYLALSIGLTLSAHYCLGSISSISISSVAEFCACGEEESMPCCSTETISVSLEDEQAFAKSLRSNDLIWTCLKPVDFKIWPVAKCISEISAGFENRGPPLTSGKDIRIKLHALIFYA